MQTIYQAVAKILGRMWSNCLTHNTSSSKWFGEYKEKTTSTYFSIRFSLL